MILIGEKVNGMFKVIGKAVAEWDPRPIQDMAKQQETAGAHYLDINTGPKAEDQVKTLKWMSEVVQEVTDLPLCLDCTNLDAVEAALKILKHPGMINSCKCEQNEIDRLFPLAVEHQAAIIGLCMNNKGVPKSAEDRAAFAMELVANADAYGLPFEDLYLDPIALPVNVAQEHAVEVLETIRQIKTLSNPAPRTVIGLSNVSQRTPHRPIINRTFAIMAMAAGLDSAILDVLDEPLVDAIATARLIMNKDIYCDSYQKVFRQHSI
ncbi:5-methyltetrahydrofolate corrinoid/iron sulfur protein methyltransferase [Sporomusaceae bacterium BoRhaA]|uniref:methyltetrahydrofolate cobalamin methyltransferase n=1 Tax=Pelorhabdus rhamnosifermentans TaxID=2772457 RepID=UPI001C063FC3|nr:methyltetrahydrofolate cobalamin methyltransferase [Pelorhabdus rhamnosifermentans]MBU2703117.1 5-methyltetrahydrofolate corrinoid/iron sulfur protein methyltransferase [Pelorhabdus rhamnosifermentans]